MIWLWSLFFVKFICPKLNWKYKFNISSQINTEYLLKCMQKKASFFHN
jgi:hypothetical protein